MPLSSSLDLPLWDSKPQGALNRAFFCQLAWCSFKNCNIYSALWYQIPQLNNAASKLHPLLSSPPAFPIGKDSEHNCSLFTLPMPLTTLSNSTGFLCSSCAIFQQRRSRLNSSLWYGEQYFEFLVSSYHREKCDNYDHAEDSKSTERYRMACFLFYSLFLF